MLRTEKAYALGPEFHGLPSVFWRIGVGSDLKFAHFVDELHQLHIIFIMFDIDIDKRQFTFIDKPFSPVKTYPVSLFYYFAFLGPERLTVISDLDVRTADYTAFSPTARDESRVRGHAALTGEDGLRLVHTVDVFR